MLFQFWSCEIRPHVTNTCKAGGMSTLGCDQTLVSSSMQLQLLLSSHCILDTHLQSPAQLFSYLHLLSCLILHLPMLPSFSHCLSFSLLPSLSSFVCSVVSIPTFETTFFKASKSSKIPFPYEVSSIGFLYWKYFGFFNPYPSIFTVFFFFFRG